MRDMHRPLGISTSLLDKKFKPALLAEVAARGITHIELFLAAGISYFDSDEAVAELIAEAQRQGITFWSVHAPFGSVDLSNPDEIPRREAVQAVVRSLDVAQTINCELVVIHAGLSTGDPDEVQLRRRQSIRSINELCKLSSQRGLGLAVEYLPTNVPRIGNTSADIIDLFRVVDGAPGVCMDANHANLGEPLAEAIRALADRIVTVHISDNDGINERHFMPGEGTIDWGEFMSLLDEIGYEGPLMYEASNAGDNILERLDMVVASAREYLNGGD
jgi:sugar phosphate isomerase/epimerase